MKEFSTRKKIFRSLFIFLLLGGLLLLGYYVLVWTGIWENINSVEKIKEFILGFGFYGRLAFVVLQFLQVTILPLPSAVTTVAGSIIYGPFQASLLSLAGILLGSFFAFLLGRTFGKKIVVFMVGKGTCEKWRKSLSQAKYSFLIMMFLPFFPDDILCLVAGVSNIKYKEFFIITLLTKPVGIFIMCFFGSSFKIPFAGWGIIIWILIILAVAITVLFLLKNKRKIHALFIK